MSDDKELDAGPTLAGRVGEGIKQGIVGLGLGAAAGYVTGTFVDGFSDIATSANDAKDAAQETLNQTGKDVAANIAKVMENASKIDAGQAIEDSLSKLSTIFNGDITNATNTNATNVISDVAKNVFEGAKELTSDTKSIDINTANEALHTKEAAEALSNPEILLAKAGAVAGATFKAGEGFLSSQADKRQDLEHNIQQQQIQGVGQLAGMALAASASANEGLKVLGKHTERLIKERQQQHTAVDNNPSLA